MRIPSVARRVEKLFPSDNMSNEDRNILLNTIRFPKNLLYLTERLPKPRYASVDSAGGKTFDTNRMNVTDGAEYDQEKLPALPKLPVKRAKHLSKPQMRPSPDSPAPMNPIINYAIRKERRAPLVRPYKIPKPKRNPELSVEGGEPSVHHMADVEPPSKPAALAPSLRKVTAEDSASPTKDATVVLPAEIRAAEKPKKKPKAVHDSSKRQFLENLMKNNLYGNDSYLQELLPKRNPIIKGENIQRIAGIYAAGLGDARHVIALNKRYIGG